MLPREGHGGGDQQSPLVRASPRLPFAGRIDDDDVLVLVVVRRRRRPLRPRRPRPRPRPRPSTLD